jgi:hypothetical protein
MALCPLTEYSHDPAVLYAWREKLADAIDESGIRDIDLWKDGFSLTAKRNSGIH